MKKYLVILFLTVTSMTVHAQFYGVRTNAVALLTGTVNAGMEIAVSNRLTMELDAF